MFQRLNPCCYFTLPLLISRGVTYPPQFFSLRVLHYWHFIPRGSLLREGREISSVEWDVLNEINYFNSVEEKMDGVTNFLDYSRVLFRPSHLPAFRPPIRELERNLRVGHTTFLYTLSLSSSIALFPLAATGMSDISRTLSAWVPSQCQRPLAFTEELRVISESRA